MKLVLDARCQEAIEAAKRALPEGARLDAGILLAALYHVGRLESQFPELKDCWSPPVPVRDGAVGKVALDDELKPLLQHIAEREEEVSCEKLFDALLQTAAGRRAVRAAVSRPTATPAAGEQWRDSAARAQLIKELAPLGRMLTATPLPAGQVTERERVVSALYLALCQRKRRCALLVGPSGCGKTAIVVELARRLARQDPSLPALVRDLDIFRLSPTALRAKAGVVGEYDARVSRLLELLRTHRKVVLFVDEVHSLFQSAAHDRGPFTDANESFKPALGEGEIAFIGCTTPQEYRRFIEPDPALAGRFKVIRVEAPSRELTVQILLGRRAQVEGHYRLRVPDPILEQAVALTEDYLPARHQPAKAIQLLDDACTFCLHRQSQEVTEQTLLEALEETVGRGLVRVQRLAESEVFEQLRRRIVGQDAVLQGLARAFVAAFGGWARGSGPRGVFLFAGPTGVGKTETALKLARILGRDRENLIRVDCNTLSGSAHDNSPAVHQLLGVPPGFAGYVPGKGGALSRVRDLPEGIVLFDEIEKASATIGQLLLQIIDEGKAEDSEGNLLDFRRTFFVFTTNAGSVYAPRSIGFTGSAAAREELPVTDTATLHQALKAAGMAEEFVARLTHTFVFAALDRAGIGQVLERQLAELSASTEMRGLALAWPEDLVSHLAASWEPRFGVRCAAGILRNRLLEQLNLAEAQGELKDAKRIRIEVLSLPGQSPGRALAGLADRRLDGDCLVIELA